MIQTILVLIPVAIIVWNIIRNVLLKKIPKKKLMSYETAEKFSNIFNKVLDVFSTSSGSSSSSDTNNIDYQVPGLEDRKYGAVRRDRYGNLYKANGEVVDKTAEIINEQERLRKIRGGN